MEIPKQPKRALGQGVGLLKLTVGAVAASTQTTERGEMELVTA